MWSLKQDWKMIANTTDLMSYELSTKEMQIRIEARKTDDETWAIFKSFFDDASLNYTQEYRTATLEEAQKLVAYLQKEILPSKKDLYAQKIQQAKKAMVKIKRHFKDYNVEKWSFAVNDDAYENVVYVRDAEVNDMSIIMHEKHKQIEANVLHELKSILGLDTSELDIRQELYYYTTKSDDFQKNKKFGLFLGNVEMGFDMTNDEK